MRFHLLTVEGTHHFGENCQIVPSVLLRGLVERGPKLMVPRAGEEVELVFPDGSITTALIVSFGISAWKDGEGNLYTNSDPADPSVTLTIKRSVDLGEIPPGTEIWLRNARSSVASDAS